MDFRPGLPIAVMLALTAHVHLASAAELVIDRPTLTHLAALAHGEALKLDAFPIGPAHSAAIRFQRVQVYSNDAHIYVITATGKKEVPRSDRIFLRGYSDDGSTRVAMSLNSDSSFAAGNGSGPDGSFVLHASTTSGGVSKFVAQSLESTLPADIKLDFRCGNENQNLDVRALDDFAKHLGVSNGANTISKTASADTLRVATVAVDTDSLFMSNLFSNNTTQASNWLASMFNTMNTMYEPDLDVVLRQGTTMLRVGSDPYGSASDVPADGTDLDIFGTYWENNEAAVPRSFATLLSGRGPCSGGGCSASGIAWVGSYCQTQSTGGSYTVVQVFSSLSIDPEGAIAARLDGHELGHNFGASHTHCTDITTGTTPAATNTIDQCYNGEAGLGCYAGATSCPSSGPGAPAGTIMSYCNIRGCGSDSQNVLQFHPTQITKVLLPAVAANTPSCLVNDDIFFGDFQ